MARLDVMTGRKYTGKDGVERTNWTRVGVAFTAKDGVSLNVQLDALPIDGRLFITPPRERQERQERPQAAAHAPEESDAPPDDLPF